LILLWLIAMPQIGCLSPLVTRLRPASVVLLALFCCAGPAGCVRRRMTIRTFPPGAQVFVDDQEVGITPCSTAFVYYGTRKLTLIKDGYKTETLYQKFNPPWYQYPPLDFITENLLVTELRDERVVDVQMLPQEVVTPSALLQRAEGLRTSSRSGQITSLPDLPPGATPVSGPATGKIGLPGQGLPGSEPQPYYPLPPPPGSTVLPRYQPPPPGTLGEPIAPDFRGN
jgi:hypothetical protein